ncbi:hypothetical protein IMCC3317_25480 [Kordia antarctica]|uniref:Uncharacterized protein n=1 Tax=Kordia antarctica TaxID=1218801 RepID=A0A7L4ZKX7_9FLAO|nr:hypothetical protein [Kordia antarctica]QHI37170.1 hypothetical protein IMCC3317_25480 [Kordia antarctica]
MKNKKSFSLSLKKVRVANLNLLKAGATAFTHKDCMTDPKVCPTTLTPRTDSLDDTGD